MNKILTLALVAITVHANGQSTMTAPTTKEQWRKNIRQMMMANSSHASKTTATLQRVVAQSTWLNQGSGVQFSDSATYTYSGDRGSFYDFDYLGYYTYNGEGNVQADSVTTYNQGSTGPVADQRGISSYNSMNQPVEVLGQSYNGIDFEDNYQVHHTYNTNGLKTQTLTLVWSGTAWDSAYKTEYHYDSQGNLTTDTSYSYGITWMANSATLYTYDANNNMTSDEYVFLSGGPSMSYKGMYTYYTNDLLKTALYQMDQGAGYEDVELDSFGYSSNDILVYEEYREWDNGMWMPTELYTKKLNGQNLPDTIMQYTWTGISWNKDFEGKFFYTSYNNPEKLVGYMITGGTSTLFAQVNYYYELYNTSIKDVAKANVAIYPNPATDNVTVKADNDIARISVMNTLGQVVFSQSVNDKTATISLAHLQSGIYMLNIMDNNNQSVTKQIVKQ